MVRYRGRVKGDLGVFLDVSTPRHKGLLSDSNPSSGGEEEEEGVVRYRGRVKGEFGAKKGSFLLFHWCPY